jgi:endoglucanase
MRFLRHVVLAAMALLAAGCRDNPAAPGTTTPPGPAPGLHVQGNRLVDAGGHTVRLIGVDRSGAEYACAQGWGIFDGPVDSAAVAAIASWHVNAVRVPMNEDCWLGINGVPAAYAGASYRAAIAGFVARLNAAGIVAILDLHWGAPDTVLALAQTPMPDRDHSPAFWRSVAAAFKGNDSVIFDLFNEPYPDGNTDSPEAWRCWRDGGTCAGVSYQAAGMQELVDSVRTAGATNVIMLGGPEYASDLASWLANEPADPLHNLAASWHIYNFSWCSTPSCWNGAADTVAQHVPLILGELGQDDGGSAFVTSLMDWMDARGGSYLAWTWDVWGPPMSLITGYDGTPSAYGQTFRTRFLR